MPRPVIDNPSHSDMATQAQAGTFGAQIEAAWSHYRSLALMAAREPRLLGNVFHRSAMSRAHATWAAMFMRHTV